MGDNKTGGTPAGARRVIVSGEHAERLGLAESLGAAVVDHRVDRLAEVVGTLHGRSRVIVDATGIPEAVSEALDIVEPEGSIVLAGYAHRRTATIPIDKVHLADIHVIGAGNNPGHLAGALNLVADGIVSPARIVSAHYPLSRAPEALALVRGRPASFVKAMLEPGAPY